MQSHNMFCSLFSHSCVRLFAIPWTAGHQASLSFTISWSLLKFISIESVVSSNHLVFCHPLLLLLSIIPAWGSFHESVLRIRWPKYWSFSFSIIPSNDYSGLISFRIDWFDLLAVQGTLKSLSSTTIWKHQFFGAQPSSWSNSHICTWLLEKTIALTIRTLIGEVMSLLFNMISRFVIAFLPRRMHLLITTALVK